MGFAIDRVEKGRVDERFLPRNVRDARLLWYHGEQLVGGAVFLCREVININYELLGFSLFGCFTYEQDGSPSCEH